MIHTFAAIYIGSYEVSIKIFEISGKKKIRDIDYIRSRIELGRDAYSKGSIGYELVEALCDTLAEYKKIMDGYRVDSYEAYAAAALRNAENELFILDQIRIRTGLLVKVLSNSEHRFISYKSVAMREDFERMIQKGAAVVDAGGGGMQITVFSKGKVVTTQHLALGTMRMREQLARKSNNLAQYELQVEELVDKELEVFKAMYLQETKIKYLIIIGDYISEISRKVEKNTKYTSLTEELKAINDKISNIAEMKNSIPNLLNQIMYTIPEGVQLTSIQNTTGKKISIIAQASDYDQLGYFIAKIKVSGILNNAVSSSSQKSGDVVTVTIEGELP